MKTKWRDILSDAKSFPDDFKVDLGNGNVMSLGDLRSDDKESHGAVTASLSAKEKEVNDRAEQLKKADAAVMAMFDNYLKVTGLSADEALAGKEPVTRKIVASNTDLDPNDPIVGKLVSALNGLKEEMGTIKGSIATQRDQVLKPMLSTYLDDYYQDRWNDKIEPGLPKAAKGKVDFDAAMKHAEKEGYKDSRGRLDLNKAARDLTYDYRIDEEADKRATDRVKKLRDEETVAAMGRPGTVGANRGGKVQQQFKTEKGRTKSLEEAMEMARQDVDIWTGGASTGNA